MAEGRPGYHTLSHPHLAPWSEADEQSRVCLRSESYARERLQFVR